MQSEFSKIKHLYNRFGFGLSTDIIKRASSLNAEINLLLNNNSVCQKLETVSQEDVEKAKEIFKNNTDDKIKDLKKLLKSNVFELNSLWFQQMINNSNQLQEKMSLFWHSNLACRSANPYFDQLYLDIIRQQALGNFGDLLKSVAKTPAMLQFLNGQQNRKEHPNENFAREVMELFTLGRGNYSEQDVKEAARAFTGWGFDKTGNFKFRWQWHDAGMKTIFGKSGSFNGDDVIDMLLANPQTAYHITEKIYRHFVNENGNATRVKQLSANFFSSNYDIRKLLTEIIQSDWFYMAENMGNRIKTPVELLAGIFRIVPVVFESPDSLVFMERALNQILLNPPNVAGWKGGTAWIDSSSLLLRMKLPQYLFYDTSMNFTAKDIMPEMDSSTAYKSAFVNQLAHTKLKGTPDWTNAEHVFSSIDKDSVAQYLLAVPLANTAKQILAKMEVSDAINPLHQRIIYIMSLPEYQLN